MGKQACDRSSPCIRMPQSVRNATLWLAKWLCAPPILSCFMPHLLTQDVSVGPPGPHHRSVLDHARHPVGVGAHLGQARAAGRVQHAHVPLGAPHPHGAIHVTQTRDGLGLGQGHQVTNVLGNLGNDRQGMACMYTGEA